MIVREMRNAFCLPSWRKVCTATYDPARCPNVRRFVDCSRRRVEPTAAGRAAGGMSLREDQREPSGETRSCDRCSSRFIEPAVAVRARALGQVRDVIELRDVASPSLRTAAAIDPCATPWPPTLQLCLVDLAAVRKPNDEVIVKPSGTLEGPGVWERLSAASEGFAQRIEKSADVLRGKL